MNVIDMFGGKNGEAENVLMTALLNASRAESVKDNERIYDYLEKTPKTSLIVELYDEILELGYQIVKKG